MRYNLKAAYRLKYNLNNIGEVKEIIAGYLLNFRSTLRYFTLSKIETSPNIILKIAKKVYIIPPHIISILRQKFPKEKFPNIDNGIIKYAAVGYPKNPEKFLEDVDKKIQVLKEKYPNIKESIKYYKRSSCLLFLKSWIIYKEISIRKNIKMNIIKKRRKQKYFVFVL